MINEKKAVSRGNGFFCLGLDWDQGRMLMQGMSVRSCSPPAKGGGISLWGPNLLLSELPLNWCLLMARMCFYMLYNACLRGKLGTAGGAFY